MAFEKVKSGIRKRLVIFDAEGVLLPKGRYLFFEAAGRLGLWRFTKIAVIGFLYEIGLLSLERTLKKVFILFRGFTIDDLFQLFKKVPLMPDAEMVFETLKNVGYKTAIISSGLPNLFVEHLAAKLKADYAFGLELEISDGHFTGKIGGDVIKPDGKALVLKRIAEKEGLSPQDCVVVADDRNNLPMFPLCATRVGYNPDFMVSAKSDFVVKGSLSEVLPYAIENMSKAPYQTLSRSEVFRETIHMGGFLLPFVCMYLLNRYAVALMILLATLLYVASEFARLKGTDIPIISTATWKAAIKPELYGFVTAPIFFAFGIIFSLIFFPVPESYASIAILTLGDGSAAIFGRKFGRIVFPLNKGKKIEGLIFGCLFGFLGAQIFVNPMKALAGALAGMFTECLPLPISDNLTVPLVSGLTLVAIP